MMSSRAFRHLSVITLAAAVLWMGASQVRAGSDEEPLEPGVGDWPMWGGTPDRNMISAATRLPAEWDIRSGKNVKWKAELGSQSYGNPVIAGGKVFVGTNNELLRNPEEPDDRGVLMAFRESDGTFLWQRTHKKLESGRANDWPFQGVASSPLVLDDRLFYVSNRAVVFCVDTETGKTIWEFDMMEEVGSFPHNLANSSPVAHGDLLFVNTSNGVDESHVVVPSPLAPSIVALNRHTGELVWEDNSVEDRVLHGQWSPPTVATVDGVVQVISGQGDGWVRGYVAETGEKLWEFDTNPTDSVWPRTRNEIISTPVVVDNVVYIANGQDPEHGEGVGHFYAIDATKRGDITQSGRIWHYTDIRRSISTASVVDGLVYIADFSGYLHCIDAKTGEQYWKHDVFAAVWASPMVIDGKVYLGDEDGDVVVLEHGKELKVLAEMNMGSAVYGTVVPANGVLFLNNRNELYALALEE